MHRISEIQIKVIKPKDGLIGFASLVYNDSLYLSSIGIYTKLDGDGYRLTFPTKKVGGNDLHIFHPINNKTKEVIEQAVFQKADEIFK